MWAAKLISADALAVFTEWHVGMFLSRALTYIKHHKRTWEIHPGSLAGWCTEHSFLLSRKGKIEPLPALDHSKVQYAPFTKELYSEHPDIAKLTFQEVRPLTCIRTQHVVSTIQRYNRDMCAHRVC